MHLGFFPASSSHFVLSIYFDFLGKLNCRSGGHSGFLMRDWPKFSNIFHFNIAREEAVLNWSRIINKDDVD